MFLISLRRTVVSEIIERFRFCSLASMLYAQAPLYVIGSSGEFCKYGKIKSTLIVGSPKGVYFKQIKDSVIVFTYPTK